jgi:hypothetical protein
LLEAAEEEPAAVVDLILAQVAVQVDIYIIRE